MRYQSVPTSLAMVQMPLPKDISRRLGTQLARVSLIWLEGLVWVADPSIALQLKQECLFPGIRARAAADELLGEADRLLRQRGA